MSRRISAILITMLLAVGIVGCDDTADGIQEDADTIGDEVEEGIDDATAE